MYERGRIHVCSRLLIPAGFCVRPRARGRKTARGQTLTLKVPVRCSVVVGAHLGGRG